MYVFANHENVQTSCSVFSVMLQQGYAYGLVRFRFGWGKGNVVFLSEHS